MMRPRESRRSPLVSLVLPLNQLSILRPSCVGLPERHRPDIIDLTHSDPDFSSDEDDLETSRPLTGRALDRKNIPPPLVLQVSIADSEDQLVVATDTQHSTPSSTSLPYLGEDQEIPQHIDGDASDPPPRTPLDDKRGGGVYDDFDLGLDVTLEVSVKSS